MVEYGNEYYYSLQNQSGSTSSGCQGAVFGADCAKYTYDIWFTNSTVFCVSYALPQGHACPSLPYGPDVFPTLSASSLDSTNGLRLNLTLSANSSGVLDVRVSVFNTLDRVNNITNADDFPPSANTTSFFNWQENPCAGTSIGYEVLQGNYGENNYTQGTALALRVINPSYTCGASISSSPSPYFQIVAPLSEVANASDEWSGFWMGSFYNSHGNLCVENLSPNSSCQLSFVPFPAEPYTVVACDEWGQIVLLHFAMQN